MNKHHLSVIVRLLFLGAILVLVRPGAGTAAGYPNAAPDHPLSAVHYNGETLVNPAATPVRVAAGPLLIQPVLTVEAADRGQTAYLFNYIYLPQARVGFNFSAPGPVTLGNEADFAAVFPQMIDMSDAGGSVFDIYCAYVLSDNSIRYNAYEVTIGNGGSDNSSSDRLRPADLVYQGAFRLPDDFNWGARGMSWRPDGDGGRGSLLLTGFQGLLTAGGEQCYEGLAGCAAYFGEISIPTPARAANWEDLPVASLIRGPLPFDGGLAATVHQANAFVADIQYVPRQGSQTGDKLYGSLDEWYPEGDYGDSSFPTIWFSNLDGTGAQGMFHVGLQGNPLYHGRKMGEYLFSVPAWYANLYLGGRTLVTGRSRGTPLPDTTDATAGGSQGPTLFAFQPWQMDNPSGDLDALPLLYYRSFYPGCAGPDIGVGGEAVQCDYPGFSMCDSWNGGIFAEKGSKRAIMLLGHKGTTNCYYCGDPIDDSECTKSDPGNECRLYCQEDRGYHCGPYSRQVIFYDVDALGAAARGQTQPWTVLPYETWEPTEFYLQPVGGNVCGDVGGMAFDPDGGRIFMVERGLGGFDADNSPVVHVWSIR